MFECLDLREASEAWAVKKIQTVLAESSVVMTIDVYVDLFTRE